MGGRFLLVCVFLISAVHSCPDCTKNDVSGDVDDYLDYFKNYTDHIIETHKQNIRLVFGETFQMVQDVLETSDSAIRRAGDSVKRAIERVISEASTKVYCLETTKDDVSNAMTASGQSLQECTKDVTKRSPSIVMSMDKEETGLKESLMFVKSSLQECRNLGPAKFHRAFTVASSCCALDLWPKIKPALESLRLPTSEFFSITYKKSVNFKAKSEACLRDVGATVIKKVNKIIKQIERCAGLRHLEEIE